MVIEAIVENLDIKADVLRQVEELTEPANHPRNQHIVAIGHGIVVSDAPAGPRGGDALLQSGARSAPCGGGQRPAD